MEPTLFVSTAPATDLGTDLVQELRLRRWARENYVPVDLRDQTWHADVLDEMCRRDQELSAAHAYGGVARRIVPLVSEQGPVVPTPACESAAQS